MANGSSTPAGNRLTRQMLVPARLRWDGEHPYNLDYGDIYHHADGINEVQRVFIEPSGLTDRMFNEPAQRNMVVGELGFGTGLNFAVVAEHWLRKPGGQLHFISFDEHPLRRQDLLRLANNRRSRLPVYQELARQYPPLIPGWHRRYLANGRIMLSLYFGDAGAGLRDILHRQRQPVNAWLLDGFAPDRNPAMWTPDIFSMLHQLSTTGTTVASFTAVGEVRRALQTAGFAMQRIDQSPHKLHSLAGVATQHTAGTQPMPLPQQVRVVGGGIAGASAARHLAWHDVDCEVFETGSSAGGASRLPAALLHGRLLGDAGPGAQLRAAGANYAHDLCQRFAGYDATGVLQVAQTEDQQQRLRKVHQANAELNSNQHIARDNWLLPKDALACQQLANTQVQSGLYFPGAGRVQLHQLLPALLDHPKIQRRNFQPVNLARLTGSADTRPWVLACAMAARQLPAARYLELAPVAGQLDLVSLANAPTIPLAGALYQIPAADNSAFTWVGSTYEHLPWSPRKATQHNLTNLEQPVRWHGRTRAVRCVTSDRSPIAGQLDSASPIWISVGHGSMGLVSAHHCAAIIASEITGHFAPATQAQLALLAPTRFLDRQARRGYRMGARAS